MQIRQPIVTLVWAGVLLLFALALLSFLPRAQPATFQNGSPTVEISLNNYEGKVPHGQSVAQYTFRDFQSITCDKNDGNQHSTAFDDPCYHRSEVYERGTTNRVSQCERGWGGDRSFSKGTGISKVIRYGQNMVPSTCPVGLYTLKVILMGSARDEVATATADFEVILSPPTNTPGPTETDTPTATATPTTPTPTPTPTETPTPTPTPTRRRDADAYPHADRDADAYPHADRDADAYPHADRDADAYPYADGDADAYPHADRDADAYPYADRDANTNANPRRIAVTEFAARSPALGED